jgi:glycosyltransferase involved in cell wall biosynthesis
MAMHRHFVQHDDFELFVASTNPFHHDAIPSLLIQRHPALVRLSSTRLSRLIHQFEMLIEAYWMLPQVESALRQFQPDAIFTIPDNTISWLAYVLAKRTGLPLITNFQDWWPRGQFTYSFDHPYPFIRRLLEQRFRKMYAASAVAFCTSAGMRQTLGDHSHAPVLYPCPAPRDSKFCPNFQPPSPDKRLRLIYAGTVINAYGRSVLNLAKALRHRPEFEFHVYGPSPDWPAADRDWMEKEGVYRGLLPHEQLKQKLYEADAHLVVMTFEAQLRTMMETSFTTKFLEYSQYGKPILVWGPPYCQPVQIAQREGAGLPIPSDDVQDVVAALQSLRDQDRWTMLAHGAWKASSSIFDHAHIHNIFVNSISSVTRPSPLRASPTPALQSL